MALLSNALPIHEGDLSKRGFFDAISKAVKKLSGKKPTAAPKLDKSSTPKTVRKTYKDDNIYVPPKGNEADGEIVALPKMESIFKGGPKDRKSIPMSPDVIHPFTPKGTSKDPSGFRKQFRDQKPKR